MATRPSHLDSVSIARSIDAAISAAIKRGKAQFNGTGSQTVFVIPHGLGVAPASVSVDAGSAAAAAPGYATVDATNITVTFTSAPASGTNNVVLWWTAIL